MTLLDYLTPSFLIGVGIAGAIIYGATGKFPAFGRDDYDPNEIAKDGPFRASRKWLHVQKVMTACTVYAIALSVFLALDWRDSWPGNPIKDAGYVAAFGPMLFSKLREMVAPTDPDRHTFGEIVLDAITDAVLYGTVWILYAITVHDWRLVAIDTVAFATLYRVCRNGARP